MRNTRSRPAFSSSALEQIFETGCVAPARNLSRMEIPHSNPELARLGWRPKIDRLKGQKTRF